MNSQVAVECVVSTFTAEPPVGQLVTLVRSVATKPPQGDVSSASSSKPRLIGVCRTKCASVMRAALRNSSVDLSVLKYISKIDKMTGLKVLD